MGTALPDLRSSCLTRSISIETLKTMPLYSEEHGIALGKVQDPEYFKWFLASLLFGGHISETIAAKTYRAFRRHRLLRPKFILDAGRSYLVETVMREEGYVRYDGRKSTQVLRNCETLLTRYGGSRNKLHTVANDASDVEARLQDFFGVGPITANILLRKLRPYWRKSNPDPLPIVYELATKHGINLDAFGRKTLAFARIEAGLIRSKHRRTVGCNEMPQDRVDLLR